MLHNAHLLFEYLQGSRVYTLVRRVDEPLKRSGIVPAARLVHCHITTARRAHIVAADGGELGRTRRGAVEAVEEAHALAQATGEPYKRKVGTHALRCLGRLAGPQRVAAATVVPKQHLGHAVRHPWEARIALRLAAALILEALLQAVAHPIGVQPRLGAVGGHQPLRGLPEDGRRDGLLRPQYLLRKRYVMSVLRAALHKVARRRKASPAPVKIAIELVLDALQVGRQAHARPGEAGARVVPHALDEGSATLRLVRVRAGPRGTHAIDGDAIDPGSDVSVPSPSRNSIGDDAQTRTLGMCMYHTRRPECRGKGAHVASQSRAARCASGAPSACTQALLGASRPLGDGSGRPLRARRVSKM